MAFVVMLIITLYLGTYLFISHFVPEPGSEINSKNQTLNTLKEDSLFIVKGTKLPTDIYWLNDKNLLIGDYEKEELLQ